MFNSFVLSLVCVHHDTIKSGEIPWFTGLGFKYRFFTVLSFFLFFWVFLVVIEQANILFLR
jgi:hypothetical protein